jgi:hypothetical protein
LARERALLSGDGPRSDRNDASETSGAFGGFWGDKNAFSPKSSFESEALARSVEASARGFERLGNQLAELQSRLDSRDADVAALRAQVEKKTTSYVSYRGVVPGMDDRRPAAMILAEAAALRAARDSVERARGIRVSRSPPASPAKTRRAAHGGVVASGSDKETADKETSEEVDEEALSRIQEETRASLGVDDTSARDASMARDAEARREKLAGLYERLGAFSPSPTPKRRDASSSGDE